MPTRLDRLDITIENVKIITENNDVFTVVKEFSFLDAKGQTHYGKAIFEDLKLQKQDFLSLLIDTSSVKMSLNFE